MRKTGIWNRYVALGGVVVSVLTCAALFLLLQLVPLPIPEALASPSENAITVFPVQTYTPTPLTGPDMPGETPSPTPPSIGGMQVGLYAKITGTNGAGLRMRSEPGLTASVKFLGMDDEVFLISEGPVERDGYLWWRLTAPYDETRSGWAASDFLAPIE